MGHPIFAHDWLRFAANFSLERSSQYGWQRFWGITPHERLRLRCSLDAIIAELYGLDYSDLAWVLRDCDHPIEHIHDKSIYRTLDPKGFWRVDKEKYPELRLTVLTLAAFCDLKDMIAAHSGNRDRGLDAFCNQNDGDGWMLPETLRLADIGLGHDERAKIRQPVRERLGERFLPWQLKQTPEESWAECELHARNILGSAGFARLQAELRSEMASYNTETGHPLAAETPDSSYSMGMPGDQRRLFPGEPTLFGESMVDPSPRRRGRHR